MRSEKQTIDAVQAAAATEVVTETQTDLSILQGIADPVLVMTAHGRIRPVNPAAVALLGAGAQDIEAATFAAAFAGLTSDTLRACCESVQRTRATDAFTAFHQGTREWLSFRVSACAEGVVMIARDVTSFKQHEAQLHYTAWHDGLTDLPDRRLCLRALEAAVALHSSPDSAFSVFFVDIDWFKLVNDLHGHEGGDAVLIELAARFRRLAGERGFVARFSGDEFVFLLDGTQALQPQHFAEQLLQTIREPLFIKGSEVKLGGSVGIACYGTGGTTAADLLKNADLAMYAAKAAGRNCSMLYCEQIGVRHRNRRDLQRRIRDAIEGRELVLHYQPQVCLATGRLTGAEALVRWAHPEEGLLLPERFIPAAEESLLIVAIGRAVIEMACKQISLWERRNLPAFPVSVNLSARDLNCTDLPDFVATMLARYGVAPQRLRFEITESMLTVDLELASSVLSRLTALGVTIALDDFGTGYSNLVCIQRFPIQTLKIDRSFLRDAANNESSRSLTRAVISLGKSMGLKVLAEGVETPWQRDFLRREGCDEAQGYLFGRPLEAHALEVFARPPGHALDALAHE